MLPLREKAPVQCADRFHIIKNLIETAQVLLARCQAEILAVRLTHKASLLGPQK
ncbi:hypothetical protein KSX_71160 [Ktedonospora formicarum]|uniref:Uncharacterized protein n=1 Tax=Ktedonospora formicarum TaxID=2778364 RepID=A0A8J3I860_9CHLR|nr:hypothetical protein [Ktedonospora formicarum]GHO48953.1 hypothetical protein KSX_71160 [Ktedonospora formicarum]